MRTERGEENPRKSPGDVPLQRGGSAPLTCRSTSEGRERLDGNAPPTLHCLSGHGVRGRAGCPCEGMCVSVCACLCVCLLTVSQDSGSSQDVSKANLDGC